MLFVLAQPRCQNPKGKAMIIEDAIPNNEDSLSQYQLYGLGGV
jgi:hypothetical protein